jgi:protein-S-isoprenylcysteine O-methyltransferase Ste14
MADIVVAFGTALSLGSLWALIPAAIDSGLLFLRANWEARPRRQKLAGYKEHIHRVRCKRIPGVW